MMVYELHSLYLINTLIKLKMKLYKKKIQKCYATIKVTRKELSCLEPKWSGSLISNRTVSPKELEYML